MGSKRLKSNQNWCGGDDEKNCERSLVCVSIIASLCLKPLLCHSCVPFMWTRNGHVMIHCPLWISHPPRPPALQLSPSHPYHPTLGPAPAHSLRGGQKVIQAGHAPWVYLGQILSPCCRIVGTLILAACSSCSQRALPWTQRGSRGGGGLKLLVTL